MFLSGAAFHGSMQFVLCSQMHHELFSPRSSIIATGDENVSSTIDNDHKML